MTITMKDMKNPETTHLIQLHLVVLGIFGLEPHLLQKVSLPFNESALVQLKIENENESISLYVIPMDGELLVPGKSVAKILGAKATLFNTSKILEITSSDAELIFRAGTNVVYDNRNENAKSSIRFLYEQ